MVQTAKSVPVLPRRIVVGLDDQGRADSAVVAAWRLATELDARFELVHAANPLPKAWPDLDPVASMERNEKLTASTRASAIVHVRKLLGTGPGVPADIDEILRIEEGKPAHVLLRESRSPADLVVLGAHRREGLLQFGGTLRTLLARSAGPLWIQPRAAPDFQRVLVPIDMSRHSLHALGLAVAFASRLKARVHVLHAFQPVVPTSSIWPEAALWGTNIPLSELRAAARTQFEESLIGFDWGGIAHEESFVEGEAVDAILEQADRHDWIALGTHGRSGLTAAVLGSVAWRVIERAEKPLLVTRLHDHEYAA